MRHSLSAVPHFKALLLIKKFFAYHIVSFFILNAATLHLVLMPLYQIVTLQKNHKMSIRRSFVQIKSVSPAKLSCLAGDTSTQTSHSVAGGELSRQDYIPR